MESAAVIYVVISLVTLIVFFVMADNVSQIKKSLNHGEPNSTIRINSNSAPFKDMELDTIMKLLFWIVAPLLTGLVICYICNRDTASGSKITQETPTSIQHFNPSGKFH